MTSPATLIILVDALPYGVVQESTILQSWDYVVPLRPGYGFSVNLDAELFAGLTPDEVGYFNEWSYNPQGSPFPRLGWAGAALDLLGSVYPIDRVLHRVLGKVWGQSLGNIPFKQLHLFKPFKGQVWDRDFPTSSLFTEFPHLHAIAAHEVPDPQPSLGGRDLVAVELALEKLSAGQSVFLYLVDLDYVSHKYGMFTPEYDSMLTMLEHWVEEMAQTFSSVHPQGDIFLLSDHGMANVHTTQSLCLEEVTGPAGSHNYVYFLDSVMLRVWTKEQEALNTIQGYLRELDSGVLLSAEERTAGGLQDRRWGDLIFILNEGIVFNPTTYGRGVPKAMHGYHPKYDSQLAVLAHRGQNSRDFPPAMPGQYLRTRDVYSVIKNVLSNQRAWS